MTSDKKRDLNRTPVWGDLSIYDPIDPDQYLEVAGITVSEITAGEVVFVGILWRD